MTKHVNTQIAVLDALHGAGKLLPEAFQVAVMTKGGDAAYIPGAVRALRNAGVMVRCDRHGMWSEWSLDDSDGEAIRKWVLDIITRSRTESLGAYRCLTSPAAAAVVPAIQTVINSLEDTIRHESRALDMSKKEIEASYNQVAFTSPAVEAAYQRLIAKV